MINVFQNIGLQVKELADLLMVPEQTLYSWVNRKSTIPSEYYGYISGLKIYQEKLQKDDLKTVYTKWESDNQTFLEMQKTAALRKLNLDVEKNNLALQKLQQKETRLLKRLHLSVHYPKYLSNNLQQTEKLQLWCSLLYRRAAFDLGTLRLQIQKLEVKKVGFAAQVSYWEGVN